MQDILIKNFKVNTVGNIKAFVDIELPETGMIIRDIRLMLTNGNEWLAFPSKEYEKDGAKRWKSYIVFEDATKRQEFTDAVMDAVNLHRGNKLAKKHATVKEVEPEEAPF